MTVTAIETDTMQAVLVTVPTAVFRRMLKPHRSTSRTTEVGKNVQLFTYIDGVSGDKVLGVASWTFDAAKVTTFGGSVGRSLYVNSETANYHRNVSRVTVPYVMLAGALKAVGRAKSVVVEVSSIGVVVGGVTVASVSGKWVDALQDQLNVSFIASSFGVNAAYTVNASDVRHVLAATDVSGTYPGLACIKVDAGGDSGPVIVATDRYRCHTAPIWVCGSSDTRFYDALIPGDVLRSIMTNKTGNLLVEADSIMVTDKDSLTVAKDVRVTFHEDIPNGIATAAVFAVPEFRYGSFPNNWRTFFTNTMTASQSFTFGIEAVTALESALTLAKMVGRNNPLIVTHDEGHMVLTPSNQEAVNSVRVPCDYVGTPEVFALNPSYFLDMLKGMFDGTGPEFKATLSVESAKRPVQVRNWRLGSDRKALLMPVRL